MKETDGSTMKFLNSFFLLVVVTASAAVAQQTDMLDSSMVLYFEVWDADSQASTGEVIAGDNIEVCFPSSRANIEAVATDCTRRVLLELIKPDGNKLNRNEGREPYLVFGDRLLDDPPKLNGRFFQDGGSYTISALPKSYPSDVLTYDFKVKICDTPTDTPTSSPTKSPSTGTPTTSPVAKPSSPGFDDCAPSQGVCASSREELQSFLDASSPFDTVAICDGTTIDTSANKPVILSQDHLTMCCAGSNCILANDGTGRNLVVDGASTSVVGIEFTGGVGQGEKWYMGSGGNVFWKCLGDINIIDCIFRDGTTSGTGGNLHAELNYAADGQYTINIERSTFTGGKAAFDGGGLFITDAKDVFIRDCKFIANSAGLEWEGAVGGGLMISSDYGQMPKLEILNTSFNDNEKGAVSVLAMYDTTFAGNSGEGNTPHGTTITDCPDFYGPFGLECVSLPAKLP